MSHWGCTAILQIVILAMGITTAGLSAYCISYDIEWNKQLKNERAFEQQERDILVRDEFFLEGLFLTVHLLAALAGAIHLVLCFMVKKEFYLKKFHDVVLFSLSTVYFVSSIFILISAVIYDFRYFQEDRIDTRTYYIRFQENETDVRQPSRSPFYYCHMGYGKPRRAAELKGIRIRQVGSKLCQLVGLKIVAGILSVYLGIICLLTKWQAGAHDRFVNAKAAKELFELYGDSEEYEFEHHQTPSMSEGFGIDEDTEGREIVVPASAKHNRRQGINFKNNTALKTIKAFQTKHGKK